MGNKWNKLIQKGYGPSGDELGQLIQNYLITSSLLLEKVTYFVIRTRNHYQRNYMIIPSVIRFKQWPTSN